VSSAALARRPSPPASGSDHDRYPHDRADPGHNRARWDTDGVAADLRAFVAEHRGEPNAVLIVDESGDLKKVEHMVGAQRQPGHQSEGEP
jgi:SRSO17 transposase